MTKIYVTGSPYWRDYLVGALRSAGLSRALSVDFRRAAPLSLLADDGPAAVLLVGIGARLTAKRAIMLGWALVLRLLKGRGFPIIFYWIGSDVLTLRDARSASFTRWVGGLLGARHICGAPWFVEELAEAGLEAKAVLFPYDTSKAEVLVSRRPPATPYRACTYLNAGGWDNLGGALTLDLALLTPDVEWTVFGMGAEEIPGKPVLPPNVRFLGWVNDPLSVLAENHLFIRVVKHDAYSGTVREAQAMGRTVLYTMPVEGAILIRDLDAGQIAGIIRGLAVGETLGRESGYDLPGYEQQIGALKDALL